MPRDNSGNYTLPNAAFVTQTTIASTTTNSNFADIASALTQSIDSTGLSTLTGPFVAAAGAVGAPSITYSLVATSGYYLSAANEISYSFNSVQRHKWNSTGLTMVSSDLKDKNGNACLAIPVGLIVPYAGSTAPSLWLLCYGQAVSAVTYSALNTVLGTLYGTSAGNVVLPDLRGTAPFGQDSMGGVAANRITTAGSGIDGTTIGSSGGGQNITIAQANLPNVTWTSSNVAHSHAYTTMSQNTSVASANDHQAIPAGLTSGVSTSGVSLASGGSGTALASMSPTMILNYIIYAGV